MGEWKIKENGKTYIYTPMLRICERSDPGPIEGQFIRVKILQQAFLEVKPQQIINCGEHTNATEIVWKDVPCHVE